MGSVLSVLLGVSVCILVALYVYDLRPQTEKPFQGVICIFNTITAPVYVCVCVRVRERGCGCCQQKVNVLVSGQR